jgi:predicted CopG family antitoxin
MDSYKRLKKMLDEDSPKDDIYAELLRKEEKALNVLNRLAEKQEKSRKDTSLFILDMSLLELLHMFIHEWRMIFHDIMLIGVNQTSYMDILHSLILNKRKLVLGMTLVLISFFLFFVDISK